MLKWKAEVAANRVNEMVELAGLDPGPYASRHPNNFPVDIDSGPAWPGRCIRTRR